MEKRGESRDGKSAGISKNAGTTGTCLFAPGHLENRQHDGCVRRGLLLQELDEGLGNGLVDLGGLPLVPGVSAPPATWTEIRTSIGEGVCVWGGGGGG
jgi:hypothetical protein